MQTKNDNLQKQANFRYATGAQLKHYFKAKLNQTQQRKLKITYRQNNNHSFSKKHRP